MGYIYEIFTHCDFVNMFVWPSSLKILITPLIKLGVSQTCYSRFEVIMETLMELWEVELKVHFWVVKLLLFKDLSSSKVCYSWLRCLFWPRVRFQIPFDTPYFHRLIRTIRKVNIKDYWIFFCRFFLYFHKNHKNILHFFILKQYILYFFFFFSFWVWPGLFFCLFENWKNVHRLTLF